MSLTFPVPAGRYKCFVRGSGKVRAEKQVEEHCHRPTIW